jgi:hypothetical protein
MTINDMANNEIAKAVLYEMVKKSHLTSVAYYEVTEYIKEEISNQLPDIEVESAVLNMLNCSTDTVSFSGEVIVNGKHEVELDGDKIAQLIYVDIAKIVSKDLIEKSFKTFYGCEMNWNDIFDYENWFNGFIDVVNWKAHLFIGGEDEKPVKFDVLNNLAIVEGFEEGIVVDLEE